MLNLDWKYKAKFVKHPKDEYTTFQVSAKDRKTGDYKNYSIFAKGKIDLQDGDEIQVKTITGIDRSDFKYKNGRDGTNVTVYCEFEVVSMADDGNTLSISSDDLPFWCRCLRWLNDW